MRTIDLREYRQARERSEVARLTRQLVASVIRMDLPPMDGESYVVGFVDRPSRRLLVAGTTLTDFEVRLAAYAAASRIVSGPGDSSFGWTAECLVSLIGMMGPNPERMLAMQLTENVQGLSRA